MAHERKSIAVEIKATPEGRIEGYASKFGEEDDYGDVMVKGAFAGSLASGRKVRMLWQHNPSEPIGVWDEVAEDETGLRVSGRILEATQKGREARELVAAGVIDGMSIGYRTVRAGRDDAGLRLLHEVDLWEVSLVTFPALASAQVDAVKAMMEFDRGNSALVKRMLEHDLREAGFSNTEANAAAAAAASKLVALREAGAGFGDLAQFMRDS